MSGGIVEPYQYGVGEGVCEIVHVTHIEPVFLHLYLIIRNVGCNGVKCGYLLQPVKPYVIEMLKVPLMFVSLAECPVDITDGDTRKE